MSGDTLSLTVNCRITATLTCKAGSLCGGPMVFELVELAKESLTDNNLPCGDCVVCLQPFKVLFLLLSTLSLLLPCRTERA